MGFPQSVNSNVSGVRNSFYRITDRFIRWIVPDLEVGVVERLLAADSFSGVETQHLREKVYREGVGMREERREWHSRLDGE
jgi:hypothetical protein